MMTPINEILEYRIVILEATNVPSAGPFRACVLLSLPGRGLKLSSEESTGGPEFCWHDTLIFTAPSTFVLQIQLQQRIEDNDDGLCIGMHHLLYNHDDNKTGVLRSLALRDETGKDAGELTVVIQPRHACYTGEESEDEEEKEECALPSEERLVHRHWHLVVETICGQLVRPRFRIGRWRPTTYVEIRQSSGRKAEVSEEDLQISYESQAITPSSPRTPSPEWNHIHDLYFLDIKSEIQIAVLRTQPLIGCVLMGLTEPIKLVDIQGGLCQYELMDPKGHRIVGTVTLDFKPSTQSKMRSVVDVRSNNRGKIYNPSQKVSKKGIPEMEDEAVGPRIGGTLNHVDQMASQGTSPMRTSASSLEYSSPSDKGDKKSRRARSSVITAQANDGASANARSRTMSGSLPGGAVAEILKMLKTEEAKEDNPRGWHKVVALAKEGKLGTKGSKLWWLSQEEKRAVALSSRWRNIIEKAHEMKLIESLRASLEAERDRPSYDCELQDHLVPLVAGYTGKQLRNRAHEMSVLPSQRLQRKLPQDPSAELFVDALLGIGMAGIMVTWILLRLQDSAVNMGRVTFVAAFRQASSFLARFNGATQGDKRIGRVKQAARRMPSSVQNRGPASMLEDTDTYTTLAPPSNTSVLSLPDDDDDESFYSLPALPANDASR